MSVIFDMVFSVIDCTISFLLLCSILLFVDESDTHLVDD